jgi:hypothetical protein
MNDPRIIKEFNEAKNLWPGNWRIAGYSEVEIINAEHQFGRKFPVEYREFLRHFGACCLGQHTIVGITPFDEFSLNQKDIYQINETVRMHLDHVDFNDWFVFGDDTNGNYWTMNDLGNVGFLDHEEGQICNKYSSFSEWLIRFFEIQ